MNVVEVGIHQTFFCNLGPVNSGELGYGVGVLPGIVGHLGRRQGYGDGDSEIDRAVLAQNAVCIEEEYAGIVDRGTVERVELSKSAETPF